jgi:hypothetical protein
MIIDFKVSTNFKVEKIDHASSKNVLQFKSENYDKFENYVVGQALGEDKLDPDNDNNLPGEDGDIDG